MPNLHSHAFQCAVAGLAERRARRVDGRRVVHARAAAPSLSRDMVLDH